MKKTNSVKSVKTNVKNTSVKSIAKTEKTASVKSTVKSQAVKSESPKFESKFKELLDTIAFRVDYMKKLNAGVTSADKDVKPAIRCLTLNYSDTLRGFERLAFIKKTSVESEIARTAKQFRYADRNKDKANYVQMKVIGKYLPVMFDLGAKLITNNNYVFSVLSGLYKEGALTVERLRLYLSVAKIADDNERERVIKNGGSNFSMGTSNAQTSQVRMFLLYSGIGNVIKGKKGDVTSLKPEYRSAIGQLLGYEKYE